MNHSKELKVNDVVVIKKKIPELFLAISEGDIGLVRGILQQQKYPVQLQTITGCKYHFKIHEIEKIDKL